VPVGNTRFRRRSPWKQTSKEADLKGNGVVLDNIPTEKRNVQKKHQCLDEDAGDDRACLDGAL